MLRSGSRRPHRRLLTLGVISLVVLVTVGTLFAVQQAGGHISQVPPGTATSPSPLPSSTSARASHRSGGLDGVPASDDPHEFAGDVARAIFAWDTAAGYEPGDYKGRLLVLADPSGYESPGLAADLTAYLPTAAAWAHLARYGTRQWLVVTDVVVPDQWAHALAQAPAGAVAPGTTALTVTGVRHRAGTWEGTEVAAEFDVAFTVFVICEPTYPTCHLLRLSQLDNPLR